VDSAGKSALQFAVETRRPGLVSLLLTAGASIPPGLLHSAVRMSGYLTGQEISLLLIRHGADVTARDRDGRSPLSWAVCVNNKEIVEELIEQAIESARPTILAEPEPSKSADAFPLEVGWDEEDTWEDYDSEFDLEDCRQSRIPAYVEFEIGVWSSALWTSDMKWEKPVVAESEEAAAGGHTTI